MSKPEFGLPCVYAWCREVEPGRFEPVTTSTNWFPEFFTLSQIDEREDLAVQEARRRGYPLHLIRYYPVAEIKRIDP